MDAVIFADDVTAGERLRAIEQLRELEGEHACPRCAVFDPPPDPDGFWEHTDDLLSSLVPFLDAHGTARMPLTTSRMMEIVEREAEVKARLIADASRIEAEVRERAEALAKEMYEARSFAVVASSEIGAPSVPAGGPPGPRLAATTERRARRRLPGPTRASAGRPDTSGASGGWVGADRSAGVHPAFIRW